MNRKASVFAGLSLLALILVALNVFDRQATVLHEDRLADVLYLSAVSAALNIPHVRLEKGRLSLIGIPVGVAALTLNPLNAGIVGLTSSIYGYRRGPFHIV